MADTTNATPKPAPAVEHEIAYVIDGFPMVTRVQNADATQLKTLIDRLKAIGAVPPVAPAAAAAPSIPAPAGPPGVPICPTHGTPMKLRQSGNSRFYSCPTKNDDGSWCKNTEKA